MQESAAEELDNILPEILGAEDAGRMLSSGYQNVVKEGVAETEPRRIRTSNRLIKRADPRMLLNNSKGDLGSNSQKFSPGYYIVYYLIPYGVVRFVGKMLAKILLFIESIDRHMNN